MTGWTPLSRNERLGITFIVITAAISAFSVFGLLLFIALTSLTDAMKQRKTSSVHHKDSSHIHHYLIALLCLDLLQAVGGLMNGFWAKQGGITEGPYCTAQAIAISAGGVGVALMSLAIGVHTFLVLVTRWHAPHTVSYLIIGIICVVVALFVGLGHGLNDKPSAPYFGNTGLWCWITTDYPYQRIFLDYLWVLLPVFGNSLIYIFLALMLPGYVTIQDWRVTLRFGRRQELRRLYTAEDSRRSIERTARRLLLYPAVNIITTLPIAVVRFVSWSSPGFSAPLGATTFALITFQLSGLMDVILFCYTRPKAVTRDRLASPCPVPLIQIANEAKIDGARGSGYSTHQRDFIVKV